MDTTEVIKRSIARVISSEGATLGTAFAVSSSGHLLTCWHVAEGLSSLRVLFEGDAVPVTVELIEDLSNAPEDVAVLSVSKPHSNWVPLGADWKVGDPVWAYGYQYQKVVASGYPVFGQISGSTVVSNGRQLIVVSGTDFQKGLSGAPLLNLDTGLVIGIVNALLGDKGVGFATPITTVMEKWTQLGEHVHQDAQKAIAKVASLFEMLGYEVETGKAIVGVPILDIYGEIKVGFSTTRTAISCLHTYREITKVDLEEFAYRICAPLYGQKRIENAFAVSVNNQPFTPEALEFAASVGVRAVTFRELEANLINFSRYITAYLDHFENYDRFAREQEYPIVDQLQWRDLHRYYVSLRCKDLLHPEKETEDLDNFIGGWLEDDTRRHLSVLGDYGSGKTSFCLHLVYHVARSYQENPASSRIPLFFALRDCSPHIPLRTFILDKLTQYHIVVNDYQAFERMALGGRLLLIFDGFDELAENADEQTALKRFREISSLARGKSKVVLTCRTHYFKTEKQSVDLLVPEVMTPIMLELTRREEYSIVELQGFDEAQILELISKHTDDPQVYWNDIQSIYNLADLATRPILLTMILQTLPRLREVRGKVDSTSLYDLYARYWLERDKWRSVLSIEDKFRFVEELAWQMFVQSSLSIHYDDLLAHIEAHFGGRYTKEQIAQTLDTDIRTSSFLARDKAGYFTFMHKSFMEFLVGRRLVQEIEEGQFESLEHKLVPLAIMTFLNDLISPDGIQRVKQVAIQSDRYSGMVRGTCMDILLLLGETITEVPWIFALSFSPDGNQIATGSADCKLRIWDLRSPEHPSAVITSHRNWVRTVHYSPKGDYLASSGWDGCVKVWRADDLVEVHSFQLDDKVVSVVFAPDGSWLAAGGFDRAIHIWEIKSGSLVRSLRGHYGVVWDICFSPDGKHIASACTDNLVRIWDTGTGELEDTLRGHNDGVSSVCFSADGRLLFSGDWQGEIIAWSCPERSIAYRIQAHSDMIGELHVSPDGRHFASCGDDLKVKVWLCESGGLVHVFSDPTDFLPAVQFSPDGRLLACGGYDQNLRVWDRRQWSILYTLKHAMDDSS